MTRMHCFAVPALHPEPAQTELNLFLSQQRVLALRREFINDGANSCWVFCVELAVGPGQLPEQLRVAGSRAVGGEGARGRGGAVDYKELLSATDFAQFAALRELRKELAASDGLPVFAVFTNEQLAALVTQQVHSQTGMASIEGIGPARLKKYARAVLECLEGQRALQAAQPGQPDAEPNAPTQAPDA